MEVYNMSKNRKQTTGYSLTFERDEREISYKGKTYVPMAIWKQQSKYLYLIQENNQYIFLNGATLRRINMIPKEVLSSFVRGYNVELHFISEKARIIQVIEETRKLWDMNSNKTITSTIECSGRSLLS